jgi:hypothetical protein
MKKLMFALLMVSSFSAQAGTLKFECTPNASNPWFKKLNLSIGREYQVSGSYVGYQNQDNRVTDLQDKSQWMFPVLSAKATDAGVSVTLDFQGRMGSDEDIFELAIARDGSAVLTGKSMYDCGDGNWNDLDAQAYTCKSVE